MTVSVSERMFMVVGLIDLVGLLIWIGICLHLAYTKIEFMLEHLKNSSAILTMLPLRDSGPWGKLMLVGGVSGLITFSSFYIRRGALNVKDLDDFPIALKRKLIALQWSVIVLVSVMAVLAGSVKLGFV